MIFESLTKQYPTHIIWFREMQHLKIAPCPASRRQLSRGVMTVFHIYGAAMFPYTKPCGGVFRVRAHLSPSYAVSDSPKSVLAECSMFWGVVNVHMIGSLFIIARFIIKEGMLWTTRL